MRLTKIKLKASENCPHSQTIIAMNALASENSIEWQQYKKQIAANEDVLKRLFTQQDQGVWVFGYGSLLWNVNFNYTESQVGFIKGYVRRFWQASTDHRGTPENPGRVVTLARTNNNQDVWGVAYFIPPEIKQESLDILNFREKGGYSIRYVDFFTNENHRQLRKVLLYMGETSNKDYLGESPLQDIAGRISQAAGPSGPNKDYLFNLVQKLVELGIASEDDRAHSFELCKLVNKILTEKS